MMADINKEGILRKRVNYFRVYQKFYVILRDGRIDLLNEKSRELHSSIVLSAGFSVSELSRTHKKPVGHATDLALAFSIHNGDNLLARFMGNTEADAQEWRNAVMNAINAERDRPRRNSLSRRYKGMRRGEQPHYVAEKAAIASKVGFEVVDNVCGLNVFREVDMTKTNVLLKTGCMMNTTAENMLSMVLADDVGDCWEEWEERTDILDEDKEKHLRVEHVRWFPINVLGFWTSARDFVLQRYWMSLDNGCQLITYRSVQHPKAPESPNYIRGSIWMLGLLITPQTPAHLEAMGIPESSCWVDFCFHFDPAGWLSKMPLIFHQHWAYSIVRRVSLMREDISRKRYVQVDYQAMLKALRNGMTSGSSASGSGRIFAESVTDDELLADNVGGATSARTLTKRGGATSRKVNSDLDLTGSFKGWQQVPLEIDSLMVRGKNYLHDRKKVPCTKPIFKLVAVDLFETEDRVRHIASRSDNLVHRLVNEGGHPFIFLVHFTLPGPPFYSFVCYFAAKHEDMEIGNPFGDLLNKFLNSPPESDFRDLTFKLIPRVVEGSWIVKKAVGTTPAILGKKLDIEYFGDGEKYFELMVDVGSSTVAGSILGVVKGYAASISIDLAFMFEGREEAHLPECILGAVRIIRPNIAASPMLPHYLLPTSLGCTPATGSNRRLKIE